MSQKDGDQRATKEAWRTMGPWGWPTINQMVRPVEDVAALFPVKFVIQTAKYNIGGRRALPATLKQ